MSLLKVLTYIYIITSIAARAIRLTTLLTTMSVSDFITNCYSILIVTTGLKY
jgi:hypothetical protein